MDFLDGLNSGHFHLIGSGGLASTIVWVALKVVKPLMHKHHDHVKALTKAINKQTEVLKAIALILEDEVSDNDSDVSDRLSSLETYLNKGKRSKK